MAANPEDVFDDKHNVDVVQEGDEGASDTGSDEIEVEVDDDYEEEVEEEVVEPELVTPSKKSKRRSATPGKVEPSEKVKNMEIKSPETIAKGAGPTLSPTKNPFPTFGAWTEKTLSTIEIAVPMLTGKNETTNELTRSTRPEARYWKAPIVFKYGNYTSETLRFDNVPIPYHTGKGYGSGFIYLCLPGFASKVFAEACKTRRPTRVTEKSLEPDANRWWKVANDVEESVGVINKATGRFHKKSLEAIFDATNAGVTANVTVSFMFKAATDSKEALKPTTQGSISISLERAVINETDVNVQLPVRIVRKKTKIEPAATSKDIASDKLMERLNALGL